MEGNDFFVNFVTTNLVKSKIVMKSGFKTQVKKGPIFNNYNTCLMTHVTLLNINETLFYMEWIT